MHLTRRSALASAGIGLVAACTSGTKATPTPEADPDDALKLAAIDRERALLAAYDSAVAASPALVARLAPLRADHESHLAVLGGVTTANPAVVPAAGTAVLAALKAQEAAAAAAHAAAALTASPALAAVLASLAACEASHGAVL